jgi:NADH dehydrogenase (ubiquinone) 1 beta subcomplex subunit 9
MRPTMLLRSAAAGAPTPFSAAHKSYVQSLYRRYLRNSLNWCIRRDIWRDRAIEIRAEFERQRNIRNPRELARVLAQAEAHLKANAHPDPYKCACPKARRSDSSVRSHSRLQHQWARTAPSGQ